MTTATLQDGIRALSREVSGLQRKMGTMKHPAIRARVGGQIDGINKCIRVLGALAAGHVLTLEEAEALPDETLAASDTKPAEEVETLL